MPITPQPSGAGTDTGEATDVEETYMQEVKAEYARRRDVVFRRQ